MFSDMSVFLFGRGGGGSYILSRSCLGGMDHLVKVPSPTTPWTGPELAW